MSEPQMAVASTATTAPPGPGTFGSGASATRTRPGPSIITCCTVPSATVRSLTAVVEYCDTPVVRGADTASRRAAAVARKGASHAQPPCRRAVRHVGRGDRRGVGRREHPGPAALTRAHDRRSVDHPRATAPGRALPQRCLLYTSDAADEEDSVALGGRRI